MENRFAMRKISSGGAEDGRRTSPKATADPSLRSERQPLNLLPIVSRLDDGPQLTVTVKVAVGAGVTAGLAVAVTVKV